tara:strand:- start:331 stop:759 length:429 start_codon:yes stop_codon:yes gene_type:complete
MKKNSIYKANNKSHCSIGLHLTPIEAGFPSPADDHLDISLDLNEYLIKHPSATFYIYVKGDSMINEGIYNGDIMIVDKSLNPRIHDVVVAVIDGDFTVKKMYKKNNKIYLNPGNKDYKSIVISDDMDFQIWGVVTHTIHHCR